MIGAQLGQWVLQSELGRGGMGCVYLAQDSQGQVAAVKILAAELTTHAGAKTRFQREIEILNQLNHPNIVRFYESGSYQERLYYVMEYIDGRNYADLLDEQKRMPWPEVLDMAMAICAALKHAHDRGVIHRDIKPSNILRKADGQIKLTDFGIAHVFSGQHLTQTGIVVGTAEYLSPEQAGGKPASKRSDLYALGVVLYTLLTGRTPFRGFNVVDVLHQHRYAQFEMPRRILPDLPGEIEEIICQLLEKDPERRPSDARILQKRLENLRSKLAWKEEQTQTLTSLQSAPEGRSLEKVDFVRALHKSGPATLMSRLLRQELDRQHFGGPLRRFINRPVVLLLLFLVCLAAIVWTFWPLDSQTLFQRGQALMNSGPEHWEEAWEKYFRPLQTRFPNHPYQEELEENRRLIEERRERRLRPRGAETEKSLGEAQWFYLQGLHWHQQGKTEAARALWQNLVDSFEYVPIEKTWVSLAKQGLAQEPPKGSGNNEERWTSVRKALEKARQLRLAGKRDAAQKILDGLRQLYQDDPSAQEIMEEIRNPKSEIRNPKFEIPNSKSEIPR